MDRLIKDSTHSTKFISFVVWFSLSESSFIHQIRQLLLHQLFNFLDRLLEAFFGCARDMEVQGWVLARSVVVQISCVELPTAAVAKLLSG